MSNLTNTGSKNPFKLCPCAANLKYSDLLPYNEKNGLTVTKVFIRKVVEMLLEHIRKTFDRNEKVIDFHDPSEMETLMDLAVPEKPLSLQQLLNDCHQTLAYVCKSGHPRFFNQLSNGLDLVSLMGEWVTTTCNVNTFTYEVATIFLIMEAVIFKKMRKIIGWDTGDSTLAPGGSLANLYGVLCARHKLYPDYKEKGLIRGVPGQLVMYTSAASHYSFKRAALILGIGLENCIEIDLDETGRMDIKALEKAIADTKQKGDIPFLVNATAGTTVLGVFDPINEIADIVEANKMWLHVDAAWGGGMLMSKKYRQGRFDGIERANSVTWNPHKLMNVILQCATVHFQDEGILSDCNCMKAKYLFMDDKPYDVKYDTGDKSIQCGRRNDIFKFWLLWRARGDEGFEKFIDRSMELIFYLAKKIKEQPDKFILIQEPTMMSCSFWYIPKRLRDAPQTKEKEEEMGKICPLIKGKLMAAGTTMLAYQKDEVRTNFFRAIVSSASVAEKDIDFLLNEIDRVGQEL